MIVGVFEYPLDEAWMRRDTCVGIGEAFAYSHIGLDHYLFALNLELHCVEDIVRREPEILPLRWIGGVGAGDEHGARVV